MVGTLLGQAEGPGPPSSCLVALGGSLSEMALSDPSKTGDHAARPGYAHDTSRSSLLKCLSRVYRPVVFLVITVKSGGTGMSGQDVCPSRPPTEAASAARGAGSFGVWGAVRAPHPSTRPASPGTSGPCLCSEAFLKAPSDRASSGTAADGRRKDGEGKSDQRGHADDMTFVP